MAPSSGSATSSRNSRAGNPYWLLSESPLVDGDLVIVSPESRCRHRRLDKMSSKTVWTSKELSDGAGYASPIIADVGGVRTIMNFTADAGVGVRASDGKLMWPKHPTRQWHGEHRHARVLGWQGVLPPHAEPVRRYSG